MEMAFENVLLFVCLEKRCVCVNENKLLLFVVVFTCCFCDYPTEKQDKRTS
jgi:hypothetical protein